MERGIQWREADIELLRQLANELCPSIRREDVERVLRERFPDLLVKQEEESGVLFVDAIGLRFENGALAEFVLMNPIETE